MQLSGPHESSDEQRPRRGRLIVAIVILLASISFIALTNMLPKQTLASCTVEDPGLRLYRLSWMRPRLATDCGMFHSDEQVTCSADPSRKIHLTTGVTYDFVVQGPRIPRVSTPKVVEAVVSAEQLHVPDPGITEVDTSADENVQALQRSSLPETLRAFDYEQPPFDPSCDANRSIMTSQGIQLVSPTRAELLLTPPEGITARYPLLPCQGYQCTG